jgi:hypothetical protein
MHDYFIFLIAQIASSGLKYSSRFRNTDHAGKNSIKVPSYQPTVPSITTTPTVSRHSRASVVDFVLPH